MYNELYPKVCGLNQSTNVYSIYWNTDSSSPNKQLNSIICTAYRHQKYPGLPPGCFYLLLSPFSTRAFGKIFHCVSLSCSHVYFSKGLPSAFPSALLINRGATQQQVRDSCATPIPVKPSIPSFNSMHKSLGKDNQSSSSSAIAIHQTWSAELPGILQHLGYPRRG